MAEENASKSENGANAPSFNLQRVYLKDLSVEIPHAPGIFLDNTPPKLEFQVDSKEQELDNDMVEVSVKCSVNCRVGEKVGFLIEGEEAGIFEIKNVEDSQRKLLKGITCPKYSLSVFEGKYCGRFTKSKFSTSASYRD